jgi:hypothetical protein
MAWYPSAAWSSGQIIGRHTAYGRAVAARSAARTRAAGRRGRPLDLKRARFGNVLPVPSCPARRRVDCILMCDLTAGVLSAGRGRPARTPFALLVWALPVVVPASKCGVCRLSLIGPRICWRVGGRRDISVEALFPQDRERFELGSSGWSRVFGIDAIGSPPHCDFADQGDARVTSR